MDPTQLSPRFVERVWGTRDLEPWFSKTDQKIGEVWFEGRTPLLIKFLFTTADLSVQVHPADAYAREHHNSNGKTEMWFVLRADPGARVALGLKHALTRAELGEAANSGAILSMLNWIPVEAGDALLAPAGEIHAIGAGIALCEIQQVSDVTYRLHDYGRGRELHLDHALRVSNLHAYRPVPQPAGLLADCQYFQTDRHQVESATDIESPAPGKPWLLICTRGSGQIGSRTYRLGQVWESHSSADAVRITPDERSQFVRTFQP